MKSITKIIIASSIVTALTVVSALTFGHSTAVAQAAPQDTTNTTQAALDNYDYVAQSGDSYTLMARKAIQTYGITNQVDLSQAQIIYAETNLTQKAGSPQLDVSQKVQINGDSVKQWVESAQKLTEQQQASWNVYVQHANFNTGSVGQAS